MNNSWWLKPSFLFKDIKILRFNTEWKFTYFSTDSNFLKVFEIIYQFFCDKILRILRIIECIFLD